MSNKVELPDARHHSGSQPECMMPFATRAQHRQVRSRVRNSDAHGFFNRPGRLPTSSQPEVRTGLLPLCRMAGLLCLGSAAVLQAAIGNYQGKGGDEGSLLRSILDTLKRGDIKTTLGMERQACQTTAMAIKEIRASLLSPYPLLTMPRATARTPCPRTWSPEKAQVKCHLGPLLYI